MNRQDRKMLIPRKITSEVMDEFYKWTRNAPMFTTSEEGRVFAEELREVFNLAYETLENRRYT